MNDLLTRFIEYVKINTQSNPLSSTTPSSENEWNLTKKLCDELKNFNLEFSLTNNAYLYTSIPSNTNKKIDSIGFIAHIDTSPDYSGENVKPKIFENYAGQNMELGNGKILSPKDFPILKKFIGNTLITTSGDTLLGGDDKAGVAILMSVIKYLCEHPEVKHGEIKFAFTPDEEIGQGTKFFDLNKFSVDYAITIDGIGTGTYNYENFNAASAHIKIKGFNIHTGTAKGKMVNAVKLATQIASKIPERESPEHTEGYEGFFNLEFLEGNVEEATMKYLLRDFEEEGLEKKINLLHEIVDSLNASFGKEYIKMEIDRGYKNMKNIILEKAPFLIDVIKTAIKNVGLQPKDELIRGGTDGAALSELGLPCPNLFSGVYNCHGPYEFVSLESMEKCKETILEIIKLIAE